MYNLKQAIRSYMFLTPVFFLILIVIIFYLGIKNL